MRWCARTWAGGGRGVALRGAVERHTKCAVSLLLLLLGLLCAHPAPPPRPNRVQLSMRVECRFIKDVLNGDDATEIRVNLKEVLAEGTDYRED